MPRRTLACLLAAALLAPLSGCGKPPAPGPAIAQAAEVPAKGIADGTVDARLIDATNGFGFTLADRLVSAKPTGNVFISPLSVAAALAMTREGAAGTTKDGISRTLQLNGVSDAEVDSGYANLLASLAKPGEGVQLEIADALFASPRVTFKPEFLASNRDFFAAKVTTLDLDAPGAPDTINAWASARTHGKIPQIVKHTKGDVLELLNAVYFKGAWKISFDPAQTHPQSFTGPAGAAFDVPMMSRDVTHAPYVATDAFEAVELPYRGDRYGMVIVLPKQGADVDAVRRGLTAAEWRRVMGDAKRTDGSIAMPKFKIQYDTDLKNPLKVLGMAEAFDHLTANFSRMAEGAGPGDYWISQALHKSFVSVDESGTEAAAVTAIGITAATAVAPSTNFHMVVDRPFLFAIRDDKTGALLFFGIVRDPR